MTLVSLLFLAASAGAVPSDRDIRKYLDGGFTTEKKASKLPKCYCENFRNGLTTNYVDHLACTKNEVHGLVGYQTNCMMPSRPHIPMLDDGCPRDMHPCIAQYVPPEVPTCTCGHVDNEKTEKEFLCQKEDTCYPKSYVGDKMIGNAEDYGCGSDMHRCCKPAPLARAIKQPDVSISEEEGGLAGEKFAENPYKPTITALDHQYAIVCWSRGTGLSSKPEKEVLCGVVKKDGKKASLVGDDDDQGWVGIEQASNYKTESTTESIVVVGDKGDRDAFPWVMEKLTDRTVIGCYKDRYDDLDGHDKKVSTKGVFCTILTFDEKQGKLTKSVEKVVDRATVDKKRIKSWLWLCGSDCKSNMISPPLHITALSPTQVVLAVQHLYNKDESANVILLTIEPPDKKRPADVPVDIPIKFTSYISGANIATVTYNDARSKGHQGNQQDLNWDYLTMTKLSPTKILMCFSESQYEPDFQIYCAGFRIVPFADYLAWSIDVNPDPEGGEVEFFISDSDSDHEYGQYGCARLDEKDSPCLVFDAVNAGDGLTLIGQPDMVALDEDTALFCSSHVSGTTLVELAEEAAGVEDIVAEAEQHASRPNLDVNDYAHPISCFKVGYASPPVTIPDGGGVIPRGRLGPIAFTGEIDVVSGLLDITANGDDLSLTTLDSTTAMICYENDGLFSADTSVRSRILNFFQDLLDFFGADGSRVVSAISSVLGVDAPAANQGECKTIRFCGDQFLTGNVASLGDVGIETRDEIKDFTKVKVDLPTAVAAFDHTSALVCYSKGKASTDLYDMIGTCSLIDTREPMPSGPKSK